MSFAFAPRLTRHLCLFAFFVAIRRKSHEVPQPASAGLNDSRRQCRGQRAANPTQQEQLRIKSHGLAAIGDESLEQHPARDDRQTVRQIAQRLVYCDIRRVVALSRELELDIIQTNVEALVI